MKKEKMVTRTINNTVVEIMGIDTTTNTVTNASYTFVGTFASEAEIIEKAKANSIETFIPVKVITSEVVEKLYGMPESVFMANAVELPPRKVYD